MRRESEHFGTRELSLIHVARKLKHALLLEQLLTDAGVDYAVETDKYLAGTFFRTQRVGAFFYVDPDDEPAAYEVLRHAGLKPFDQQGL